MKAQKENQSGITLVALVVSIIVMLVLAGVSLNMTIGDNGIIKQAQNASYEMGMAALEEWLQQEYVTQYDNITDSDEGNKIAFLNRMFNYTLLLKDGSRDYIINEGKVYYLLNKSCKYIPKEVKDGLLGGDTTEYSKYIRLEDVYGVTKDLKVFYCNNGIEGAFGAIENYDIDPNASATGINGNSNMKTALTDILSTQYGIAVDSEKGVTLANASVFNNLELDGNKYTGITDISGLGDLKNLKTLTLSNLNLTSLKGLEGMPGLYYLYLKNTTVGDYTALSNCLNLQYLYLYLPSSIDETTANNQVLYLGQGLKDASGLTKLNYFGISGQTVMYDSSITKNMDNPASYSNTNKLLWTGLSTSNISSLGENTGSTKTGLYAFNDIIKNKLQYIYLNNNSISNVNALSDFSAIVELQLMCNPNLSNIDGLANHTKLERLTLHNCALTSISKLAGCNALTKLSVQANTGLISLVGIEGATNMVYLVANNCAITNIDSLANHSKIQYLNLANNASLVSVKYIQHCKALKYIYLDNNTNMSTTEVDSALNGSDKTANTLGTDILIKNCINGYNNIPKSYWDLFTSTATVLDWSYGTLGEYLYVDSAKWVKLKDRTDVTKLKLDGQTQLKMEDTAVGSNTYYGIESTLKTLTGMKALSLKGCTQVNSIGFLEPKYNTSTPKTLISGMPSLYEVDLRSVANTLTDLSVLNNCTALKRLIVNNASIDATKIVTAINRFTYSEANVGSTWYSISPWNCSGYVAENDSFPSFTNCSGITSFNGGNMQFDTNSSGVLDLTGTRITSFSYRINSPTTVKLPSTCSSLALDNASNVNLVLNKKDGLTFPSGCWLGQGTINSFSTLGLSNCTFNTMTLSADVTIPVSFLTAFKAFGVEGNNKAYGVNINSFTTAGTISSFTLSRMKHITGLSNIGNLTNLEYLNLNGDKINNISWISTLTKLTYLNLSSNDLSNISGLSSLEKIDMKRLDNGSIVQDNFNLNDNHITDITPLATAIGSDNAIGYRTLNLTNNSLDGYSVADNITALLKLHAAGLTKVIITGNNFSENEVNELKNGKTVTNSDGTKTTYAGFGSANVVN